MQTSRSFSGARAILAATALAPLLASTITFFATGCGDATVVPVDEDRNVPNDGGLPDGDAADARSVVVSSDAAEAAADTNVPEQQLDDRDPPLPAPVAEPRLAVFPTRLAVKLGSSYREGSGFGPPCVTGRANPIDSSGGIIGGPKYYVDTSDIIEKLAGKADVSDDDPVNVFAKSVFPTGLATTGISQSTMLFETGFDLEVSDGSNLSKANCGDAFVAQIHLGASVVVGLSIEWKDAEARLRFEKEYPTLRSVDALFETKFPHRVGKALADVATLRFFAGQVGGDGAKLSSIVASTKCSTSELTACRDTWQALGSYAATFGRDLKTPTPDDLGGWAVRSVSFGPTF